MIGWSSSTRTSWWSCTAGFVAHGPNTSRCTGGGAAGNVKKSGGRGKARPKNSRNAGKAEIFEDALARVSRRLAVMAKRSAAALKAERLGGGPERSG